MSSEEQNEKEIDSASEANATAKRGEIPIDLSQMKARLPEEADVKVSASGDGLEIHLEKVQVEKIRDQKQRMIQAIGCYNNPGGPTC